MQTPTVAASWSGGKDSCLAYYKALQQGHRIGYLLNFISRESQRCCFHGVQARLLALQAELIGVPLIQKETTADMQKYEEEFKEAVSTIPGVNAMVFGDIYLDEHKDWVDRVCHDVGVDVIEPLWNDSPSRLLKEFIDFGFKAVIVSCQADKFDKNFVGREVDTALLRELESRGICPCGENGEFHTLVVDGPIFKRKISITKSVPVLKEGFWKHWFLDIQEYT
jgi:uncharacterized protein (TIGR00290 family)